MRTERDRWGSEYSFSELAKITKRDFSRWVELIRRQRYLIIIFLCLLKFILNIFSISTIVTFIFFGIGIKGFVLQKRDEVLEKGLAYYLPLGVKNALLNRSLLDILCDLWFIPTISLYLKTMMAPILSTKSRGPEDAIKYLDPLEPAQRKLFITKGLAFLFPRKVTKMLLPRDYFQNPLIEQTLRKKDNFLSDNEGDSETESTLMILPSNQEVVPAIESPKLDNGEIVPMVKSSRHITLHAPGGSAIPRPNPIRVISVANPSHAHVKKSKVILSSHMLKNLKNMPGRIDPSWDNMQEYERRQRVSNIPRSQSSDKLNVLKLLLDLKRLDFLRKVSKKTAIKISGVSAAALVAQLIFFKRTRKWTKNALLLAVFLGGVAILVGSITYIIVHYKLSDEDNDKDRQTKTNDEVLALKARKQEEEIEASGLSVDE